MHIGIDGNEANLKNRVGVGQFAFNLLHSLHQIDTQNNYTIYLKDSPLPDLPPATDRWHYCVFGPQKLWTRLALPLKLFTQKSHPCLFYSPSHYSPAFSPIPCIPTIHDLGYLQYPDQFTSKDFYQLKNWSAQSIRHAAAIATVSRFSRDEIIKTYHIDPAKITIVPNGVGEPPKVKNSQATLNKFHITAPYFLYLGTLKPNKNIPFLLEAFGQFLSHQRTSASAYQLVIAGKKGWLYDEIFQKIRQLGLKKQIIFTDFITEEEKWALYYRAKSLILPSTYEGFGIPVLEAMKIGTPVIVSHIPPLIELVGQAGLVFDLNSVNDLTAKMTQVITPAVSRRLSRLGPQKAAQYSWSSSAQKLIRLFRQI